ncbi:MAG: NUDIX hydrolase [Burkholderiales bacterium]|nr:NUDIX hydrolase [Burkholderiales bacterium]
MKFGPEAQGEVAAPRDAATVLLLRDAPRGFEVFMVKRSGLSDVLGEAHVFPGGKIDAGDSSPDVLARIDGMDQFDTGALGEDLPRERAAGMFVAAARETFEEAGVLLARGARGDLAAARARLNAKQSLVSVLTGLGATLDAAALVPWVRWVTPVILAKRFDARFFLAVAPSGQEALHDDHEAVASVWLRPAEALAGYDNGSLQLAPATWMSLQHLALFDSIGSALADARSRKPPVIQPHGFALEGVRHLALPGDPMHQTRERAIPGPVRLKWDGRKYLPA